MRQALDDEVELAAAELLAPLVEFREVVRVGEHTFRLGGVGISPLGSEQYMRSPAQYSTLSVAFFTGCTSFCLILPMAVSLG